MPGIRVLAAAGPESCVPLIHLAGHALECLLKAYLSKQGTPESDLKQYTVRHNLEELWRLANQGGLPHAPVTPQWVERLGALQAVLPVSDGPERACPAGSPAHGFGA